MSGSSVEGDSGELEGRSNIHTVQEHCLFSTSTLSWSFSEQLSWIESLRVNEVSGIPEFEEWLGKIALSQIWLPSLAM